MLTATSAHQHTTTNSDSRLIPSSIYVGHIQHRRFSPKKHTFNYQLYMLAINVDELTEKLSAKGVFGYSFWRPLWFREKDYVVGEPISLRERITNKVKQLNGKADVDQVIMLVQVRCFGVYFSPANFYFCYDKSGCCTQMLAEVSNTPWNQRHYYLIDMKGKKENEKAFHVSPFMDLSMKYCWSIKAPSKDSKKLNVHIENRRLEDSNGNVDEKVFDANLSMERRDWSGKSLLKTWLTSPLMTVKIFSGIYWQALKLMIKKVPFVHYQHASKHKQ